MNRDILTLLKLVLQELENPDNNLNSGLCAFVIWVLHESLQLINRTEKELILLWIDRHRPENCASGDWWWAFGDREPRIEFLENLIKQLEDEETSH